ncbi:hypothetical protein NHX12_015711 [Muraenolepis orangiensis]|uniref:Uncharacterized protein n=1 Tax=Muraenolepis orangiensis TaxID=630683 RepID=A0A9Q0D8Y7_9TELE|nr:hypothetical protein NHX12_015711 [Muraenolepis orangiensis]
MSGRRGGVQRLLQDELGREIPYVHRFNHQLHLVVVHAVSGERAIEDLFNICNVLYTFTRKPIVAAHYQGNTLKRLLEQRWTGHLATVHIILKSFQDIVELLRHVENSASFPADLRMEAAGLLSRILKPSFKFHNQIICKILSLLEPANRMMQSEEMDLQTAVQLVNTAKECVEALRTEKVFTEMWSEGRQPMNNMADLGPAKEETWSVVAGRNLTNEAILPVFIMEREILTRDESNKKPVREGEIYHCLIQEVHPNHLRSVQRVGALWRIYLRDKEARAKLLMRGISVCGIHIDLKDDNPFSLKSRMANKNAVQINIKELPESADDSIVTEFLSQRGCKMVGNDMKRMIRYNNQLTNCSNGDRMVYIEAMPSKNIPRSVKMGTHWVKVFYYGQINIQQHSKSTQDSERNPKYSPATEESIRVIEETYNKYVEKPPPSEDVTEPIESEERESEMEEVQEMEEETASQTMEGKGDEVPTVATNVTKKKNKPKNRKKETKRAMKGHEESQDKTVKGNTRTTRQRSNSSGMQVLTHIPPEGQEVD